MIFTALFLASIQPFGVHVEGDGYLRLMVEGRQVFTKKCTLVVAGGRLAASDGPALLPTIPVPGEPTSLKIGLDGTVTGDYPTGSRTLGRLILADFPADVRPVASGPYYLCYGKPNLGNPGEGTYGVVQVDRTGSETANTQSAMVTTRSSMVSVTLKESVTVDADKVILGDIVEGLAPDVAVLDLGMTPPVGVVRTISRVQVADRLKRAGFKNDQIKFAGPVALTVSRVGQQVTHEQFANAALAKAKEDLGASVTTIAGGPAMTVPKGTIELVVENAQVSGTTERVTVAVYVGGQRFNSRVVAFKASATVSRVSVGQQVDVLLKKGTLTVQTKGTVKRVEKGQVTVEVEPSKAQVVGVVNDAGQVEVSA